MSAARGWMTALTHAAARGDNVLCRLLLEHGADPDSRDGLGRDAAWWAEQARHPAVASALRRR